jgi:hypothetical protein
MERRLGAATMTPTSLARTALTGLGGNVEDIPTSAERTADFHVSFGDTTVLIEEKQTKDSKEYLDVRAETLSQGGIHHFTGPMVRTRTLSRSTREARSQIKASSHLAHDFRLVWFTFTGDRAEAMFDAFIATLYGTVRIDELGHPNLRVCYYFRNSDFHRDADIIDGAVAAYVERETLRAKLFLNSLSPNYIAMKSSEITRAFCDAVEDPLASESDGRAFVLDAPIDRDDQDALLRYLRQKYSTGPLQTFGLGYLGAAIRAP